MLAVHIDSIRKNLSKKPILKDISLSITEGEIFGFLGPNGAGKTTTMKCLLGLITPESGSIEIFGKKPSDIHTREIIGYAPEQTYLYKYLTGREFLEFCLSFFPAKKHTGSARIIQVLEKVGLSHAADTRLNKYSKGMLQRLNLAQAFVHSPQVVFLDEPMSGLDPLGRKMVKDLIREIHAQGTTVFFNTHILGDVEEICDHFAIIHQGQIVADMQTKDLGKVKIEDFFLEKIGATHIAD